MGIVPATGVVPDTGRRSFGERRLFFAIKSFQKGGGVVKRIVIEEGMAWTENIVRESRPIPIMEYNKVLDERRRVKPVYVPPGCVCYSRYDGNRSFYLMYMEPMERRIMFLNENNNKRTAYIIINPHTYLALFFRGGAIQSGHALVSEKLVSGPDDLFGMLPIPNVGAPHGQLCEGGKAMWDVAAETRDTALSYAKFFWKSEFTAHLNNHFKILPPELKPDCDYGAHPYRACEEIFKKWEDYSKEHGEHGITGLKWRVKWKLSEILARIWGYADTPGEQEDWL
jgi:hypothetical protein